MITFDTIVLVNSKVNLLPYKSDAEHYFVPEFWTSITEEGGDCEDYAIAKYRRLLAEGVPAIWMRFATCFVESSFNPEKLKRYHCVLLVDWEGQTFVLDNRKPYPTEWQLMDYEWHKLQVAGTKQWEWAENADRSVA